MLYDIITNSPAVASDVEQLVNIFNGKHDIGTINLAPLLSAPSSSSFTLTAQAGSALGVGNYSYVFTYVTGQYKSDGTTLVKTGETLPSGSLSITTTSNNTNVRITLPTSLPSSVVAINIYRTAVGGVSYQLVATVKSGNTYYTDSTTDGNRGAVIPSSNNTGTILTIPAQPIFSCTPPNTFTSLSANVETTVPYTGSNFDSTGLYTCPATGRYLFCPQFYCNITNGLVSMNYYKNGTNLYMLGRYQNPTTTTCEFIFSPSIVVALNAGDTVKFTATATAANNVGWQNCVVSVIKVA